jgi:hypothetical protein
MVPRVAVLGAGRYEPPDWATDGACVCAGAWSGDVRPVPVPVSEVDGVVDVDVDEFVPEL